MLRRFNIWLMSLSSQRVKDKKCLKAKKTVDNGMSFVNKEFCTNGISLHVETRIALLDEKHLIDRTVIFFLDTFLECRIGFL